MKKIVTVLTTFYMVFSSGCALFEPAEEIDIEALPPTAAGEVVTVTSQITSTPDDVEQRSNGGVSLPSSDLELTTDGRNQQTIGLRFTLDVPQGSQITDSYIQFTTDEVSTGAASLQIAAENSDNAIPFENTSNNVSNRTTTSNTTNWSPPDWTSRNEAGAGQRTPSLTDIVQEVVNREGWSAGNNIAFIITGTGTRTAEAFDGSPDGAPKLFVSYAVSAPPPEPPPEPSEPPVSLFIYQGKSFDPVVKPVYDIAYRDGFKSIDVDGDGLPDSWETAYGLDPTNPNDATDPNIDPDQDLLTAQEEFLAATNPNDIDTDGDGLPDGYEVIYGLSPTDGADALLDKDGDGYSNLDEFLAGTDPTNSSTFPIVTPTSYTVEITWVAPSLREDGSTMSAEEIASFKIYYGSTSGSLTNIIAVDDPTARSYIQDFDAGVYYFAVTALDTDGAESAFSNIQQVSVGQ